MLGAVYCGGAGRLFKTMRRYDSIQALRAIAAISVVAHHVAGTHAAHAARGWTQPTGIEAAIGPAGVDLFFVITGFIMVGISRFFADTPIRPGDFFYRRVTRLVPLYWFYTSAMLLLCIAVPQMMYKAPKLDQWHVLGSYLFVPLPSTDGTHPMPLVYVGWTLNIEMMFYLVFGVALFLRKQARIALVVAVVAAFGGYGILTLAPSSQWIANPIYLEFLYGMFIGWLTFKGYRLKEPLAWAMVVGGLLLFLLFPYTEEIRATTWGLCALLVVSGAASIERKMPAFLVLLGDASYSIYLSHIFTAPAASRVVERFIQNPYLCMATVLAVSVAVGVIAYFLVEKPLLAWAHSRRIVIDRTTIKPVNS